MDYTLRNKNRLQSMLLKPRIYAPSGVSPVYKMWYIWVISQTINPTVSRIKGCEVRYNNILNSFCFDESNVWVNGSSSVWPLITSQKLQQQQSHFYIVMIWPSLESRQKLMLRFSGTWFPYKITLSTSFYKYIINWETKNNLITHKCSVLNHHKKINREKN